MSESGARPEEPGQAVVPSAPEKRKRRLLPLLVSWGIVAAMLAALVILALSALTDVPREAPKPAMPEATAPAPTSDTPAPALPDTSPTAEPPAAAAGVTPSSRPAVASLQPAAGSTPSSAVFVPSGEVIRLTTTQRGAVTEVEPSALGPGDSYAATVTVRNEGTVDLRYAMVSTTTPNDANDGDLVARVMRMTVKVNVTECSSAAFDASGENVYAGALGAASGLNVIGDPAGGQQVGDRLLSPGEVETLCVDISVPSDVGNEYQGKGTGVHFRFDSEDVRS
jgi:hypothetical protein